jgi:hypothetical protein
MVKERNKLWSLRKYVALAEKQAEKEAARRSGWEPSKDVGILGQFDEWWTSQLDKVRGPSRKRRRHLKVRETPDDSQGGFIKGVQERDIKEEYELSSNSNR